MAFTARVFTDEDFSAALAAVKAGLRADGEPLYWSDEEFGVSSRTSHISSVCYEEKPLS